MRKLVLAAGLLASASWAGEPAQRPAAVGAAVRSREWIIRRVPRREEEFVGDVSYREGPSLVVCDWALWRHESQTWQARGRVRLVHALNSGDRVEVSGERAEYDRASGRGSLVGAPDGKVSFQRFPAEGPPDEGSAQRLEWQGREKASLVGSVHVWGPRLELWGGRADYDAGADALTVSGERPVLRVLEGDWTGAVQGQTLCAGRRPERLWADGRTRGWILFKDRLEKLAR